MFIQDEVVVEPSFGIDFKDIDLLFASVKISSKGFIEVEIAPDILVNVDQAKEISMAIAKIGNGRRFPVMVKPGIYTVPDEECRKFVANNNGENFITAEAYVLNCLPQKIVANFYQKFHKPQRPTAMFEKEEDAVKWLNKFS